MMARGIVRWVLRWPESVPTHTSKGPELRAARFELSIRATPVIPPQIRGGEEI